MNSAKGWLLGGLALLIGLGVGYWQWGQGGESVKFDSETWEAQLSVEQIESDTIDEESIFSSSKLKASWTAPADYTVDNYNLVATDGVAGTTVETHTQSTSTEIMGLKSGTEYTVTLTACLDPDCADVWVSDQTATASTSIEYWQIQGTGHSYDDATQVVPTGMGSTLSYVLPYGDWAPESLQGKVKYYFNAHSNDVGIGMLVAINETGKDDIASLSSFEPTGLFYERDCEDVPSNNQQTGNKGNGMPECSTELQMLAFQMVPLESGSVRVFFEANQRSEGNEMPYTRIYSMDSQDGYEGEDFNPNPDKDFCSATDTLAGGDCQPTFLIGQSATGEDFPLTQARQQKVGYPKQDSWLWDEAPGTFMVITGQDSCDQTRDGLFYAVWDGEEWDVEMEEGCAIPLVLDAHGPVIVHLGESNYKLYYENYEYTDRDSIQYDSKPFRVLYASGTQVAGQLIGNTSAVDLADWEDEADAREVYFLWPDGTLLDDQEEAGLGDHVIWSPNEDLETQIMYMNLGGFDNQDWKQPPVGLGMAVLVNP